MMTVIYIDIDNIDSDDRTKMIMMTTSRFVPKHNTSIIYFCHTQTQRKKVGPL